uniref:Neurotransmitter-gated ion-channel ligand-binding domain-containing protein n=1 Tax=Acrobeloides nanus TaxID=290746 RepID=A0A914EKJ6_9BILA
MAQYLRWQDPRLAWDPAKYNNISKIYVPVSSLWMPPIFFYNSIQTDLELSDPAALFDYIFTLRRKTTYYTTVIVIPVFLSMVIDVAGVFSPGTSKGENVIFN